MFSVGHNTIFVSLYLLEEPLANGPFDRWFKYSCEDVLTGSRGVFQGCLVPPENQADS